MNKIIQGDCLEVMKDIFDGSIDMVLTSPPYDNLRTYNGSLDWGEHVWKPVIQELFRIIKDGGVVVWVVGDATIKGSETGTSFRQALYFKEVGFNLHDTMIYEKFGVPFPEFNRYYPIFEYMFVLSKGKPKTHNLIIDRKNNYAGHKLDRLKHGRQKDGTLKQSSCYGKNRKIKEFGVRFNIWRISNQKGSGHKDKFANKHPATFPEKLAHDHIISWSNEGDTILDPFAGSGTTGKVAKELNRSYILIEKEPEYINIIKERVSNNKGHKSE